ncbi:MAG: NAD(P)/FAD-dependent oxidoreductase, partial [Lachnospirales bacterium]
ALEGADSLTGVELTGAGGVRERLPVTGLFVAVGQEPDNRVFADLAELDAAGYVRAGEDCRTSTPGVFAAGDCRTKELRQLTTAAADGAQAAAAACGWLDQAGL